MRPYHQTWDVRVQKTEKEAAVRTRARMGQDFDIPDMTASDA